MTEKDGMCANGGEGCNSVNLLIDYKGYTIDIAFDHPAGIKKDKNDCLGRTEMWIWKDGEKVNHKFFDHLESVVPPSEDIEDWNEPDNFVYDITLNTLAYIKARIDCEHIQYFENLDSEKEEDVSETIEDESLEGIDEEDNYFDEEEV
jgi:hypothetical protein